MPSLGLFVNRIRYYCDVVSVGYDWGNRWDVWDDGETDCSALAITCLKEAGFDVGSAVTTHNLSSQLTERGWTRLPANIWDARPGDILLNDANHVAVVVEGYGWGALVSQASMGETGDVYGNQPGDQTGWETNTTAIYDYPWDCILRWTGVEEAVEPAQELGEAVNDAGLWYRAHVQNLGWCEAGHDGQVVGTTGYGLRWEALKCKPPKGWVLEFLFHIQNVGWVSYICDGDSPNSGDGSSEGDPIMGTVGEEKRIEAVGVRVLKRPEGDRRHIEFRTHQQDVGWKAWTREGFFSGCDGQSQRQEAFQMKLVA